MLKKELRTVFKNKRSRITAEHIKIKSLEISNRIITLPIWKFSFFHLFLPIEKQKEVDTTSLLTILQGKDKNVVLPKVEGELLKNFLLTDNTLITLNKWGIPEPENGIEIDSQKIDVVFIPLLAYDILGNRVGYGKGFYDKFLSGCKPNVVKIGLSFFEPVDKVSDVDSNDIPLNYCATPEKLYQF